MIIATLRIVVPPEKRDAVLQTLRSLLGPTQVQPGCISCQVHQDIENENALTLVEEWESQAELDRHIRSEEYRKVLAVMDMSSKPPEIKFNTVSSTAGMETVVAGRGQ